MLFYNREIFDRHGLKAPETCDQYYETAKTITDAEKANGIYGAVMMGYSEVRFENELPAFLSGKAALIEFWTDTGFYPQDTKGSKIIDKWEVVQPP